jgi:hypothetical protein
VDQPANFTRALAQASRTGVPLPTGCVQRRTGNTSVDNRSFEKFNDRAIANQPNRG